MIRELIAKKQGGNILAGIALYVLNLLLALDFLVASIFGADPRLSVSALLGIRLRRNPNHGVLSKLPTWLQNHILDAASWWSYDYPPINRSIWKKYYEPTL